MNIKNIAKSNQSKFSQKNTFSYYFNNRENQVRIEIVKKIINKIISSDNFQNKKILDIGCGNGNVILTLTRNTSLRVYGIDISKKNTQYCLKKSINAKTGDISIKLPYPKNSFDIIFAGEIIEHLYDTKLFLNEINRILKPNGKLILTTPNLAHLPDRFRLLFGLNPTNVSPIHQFLYLHIRPFTLNMLEYALNTCHFKISNYKSTLVVFKWSGNKVILASRLLAIIWPTLGNTLIVQAEKTNKNV